MDIVIVSTSHPKQEAFWQNRLTKVSKSLFKPKTLILSVLEDWPEGAGNGLGTLYAYQKACKKSQELYGIDLNEKLENGASIALYHTAGQGKRISPLVICEQGNKSAVKLPGFVNSSTPELLTILEGVIKQTSAYAPFFKGRLSVFWGDQIFIPSLLPKEPPKSHIAILSRWEKFPTLSEWERNKWEDYGLILKNRSGISQQMDKISYSYLESLISKGEIQKEQGLGLSLGSFTISYPLLQALLSEFDTELETKKGKMDTDPHFWMPTTLDLNQYTQQMSKKQMSLNNAKSHFERMQKFLKKFSAQHPQTYFEALDIGKDSFWWDYGVISKYYDNILKLLGNNPEAIAMRNFYNLPPPNKSNSCLLGCDIKSGKIENSFLINVKADVLNVKDCVIINSSLKTLQAEKSLLYQVNETQPLILPPSSVRADTSHQKEQIPLYTSLENDGKKDWSIRLPKNRYSYEELVSTE